MTFRGKTPRAHGYASIKSENGRFIFKGVRLSPGRYTASLCLGAGPGQQREQEEVTDKAELAQLDFSEDELSSMGKQVLERVVKHLASLPEQKICGDVRDLDFFRSIAGDAPETGRSLDGLLDFLFDDCIPKSFNTAGPGYLAFIPGGGLFPAALGEFIAASTNRFSGVWQAAPALAGIERQALDWIRTWMEFPETTRGLLTSGGSSANLTALLCAREQKLARDIRKGVIYCSAEVHHSITKAARLAGIFEDRVRTIAVDAAYQMLTASLAKAIREDRDNGLKPFFVVSSAGTVNTGAVDPLDEIADLCHDEGLWHHVDGAYGAFFYMVPQLRSKLCGLNRADSLTLDPHKGLFLPYGTGALLVRDGEALRATHCASAGYLPQAPDENEFFDISQYGPELSRPWRGIRVWLVVQLYGMKKLRAAVHEKRELALWAAERLDALDGLNLLTKPALSLFAFHVVSKSGDLKLENRATEDLLHRVRERGQIMMSGCHMGERYLGRICVMSFRTRRKEIELAVEQITAELAGLRRENAEL